MMRMPRLDKYTLIGRLAVPCFDLMEWARWFETADRVVARTDVGPLRVSTVFLGMDHSWEGRPHLFETMIFGDFEEGYQTRCATWDEAEQMHMVAVEHAEELVARADAMLAVKG